MDRWMNQQMDGRIDGWLGELMNRWMNGQMDGLMNGWIDEWIVG